MMVKSAGEVFQVLRGGTAQQLVDEQVLAGQLVHNAEGLGVLGVRTRKAVEHEDRRGSADKQPPWL